MKAIFDVVVIGGGVIGMAFAHRARKLGFSVAVIEREKKANGGSIRNFGMIWPIGQPVGKLRDRAMRSREVWLNLAREAGIWINKCGSMHVAHEQDEKIVLEEFRSISAASGFQYRWLDQQEALVKCKSLRSDMLIGALFSQDECVVDPPQAIYALKSYLIQNDIVFCSGLPAIRAKNGTVELSDGTIMATSRTIIASGTDLFTLYPNELAELKIQVTKLQMFRTKPQPSHYSFGPHLAFGLTLPHYSGFAECPSLPKLKERLRNDFPDHFKLGIHVMASMNQRRELVLGDSHVYGDDITPFDSTQIEKMIMDYLRIRLHLEEDSLDARWNGMYAKHSGHDLICKEISKDVWTALAPGGCGMTMCHGWAEDTWREWGT